LQVVHEGLPGQALHAAVLGFDHPATGERIELCADPPAAFDEALEALRSNHR
jgi:23S rRNA pseudouridine1911/1915/1917 synthase